MAATDQEPRRHTVRDRPEPLTCPTTSRCGACGWRICQPFDQYATSARRASCGHHQPAAQRSRKELDWVIVRENSEANYAASAAASQGLPPEVATDVSILTRAGVERNHALCLHSSRSPAAQAAHRRDQVQRQRHAMVMWDEIAVEIAAEFKT